MINFHGQFQSSLNFGKGKFDPDNFLFTVDFESLHINIPVQHAIELMKELVLKYRDVISNAEIIIDLLELIL